MKKLAILIVLDFIGIQFVPMDVPADVPTKAEDSDKST
jgi:hypothetical protein